MLDDFELFSQLCQKQGFSPESEIVDAVKLSCSTGELRLAHISIIAGLCEVIAQVLSSSSTIKLVDLNDCMLLSKGLSSIFKALCEGSSVTSLYLKGNNISGSLVEQLGQVLSTNNTLKIMHLEWNSLGSHLESFGKFCDGLSKNHHLEELDLQYNQISTLCADSLAAALKSNKSLKKLNLAWNSLGLSGGKKLLQGVEQNRCLIFLNLKGNCVPSEIYSTIKERISKNQGRQKSRDIRSTPRRDVHFQTSPSEEEPEETDNEATNRLQRKKKKKHQPHQETRDSPLGDSGAEDVSQSPPAPDPTPELQAKVAELEELLRERLSSLEVLRSELDNRVQEAASLRSQYDQLRSERQVRLEELTAELESERRELEKALKERQEAESRAQTLERELRRARLELQSSREQLEASLRAQEDAAAEARLELQRLRRELREREARHRLEGAALRDSLRESSASLEQCQEQLQRLREELRASAEAQAGLRARAEEAERGAAKTARLQEQLQEVRITLEQSQRQHKDKVREAVMEAERRSEAMGLELKLEQERAVGLKVELREERAGRREQAEQLRKALGRMDELYGQLAEAQAARAEAIRAKDAEVHELRLQLEQKSRELAEFRSEQSQKLRLFQAAVSKYLGAALEPN